MRQRPRQPPRMPPERRRRPRVAGRLPRPEAPPASRAPGPSASAASAGPLRNASMQPRRPHQQAGPDAPRASIQGRGLCPHSPATRLRPSTSRPSTTNPAPVPVPRIAAKTLPKPGARAVRRLAQREAVGIVGDPHGPAEARGEVAVQPSAVQPGAVRPAHQPGRGRKAAGDADADRRARRARPARAPPPPPARRPARPWRRSRGGVGARRRSSTRPSGPRAATSVLVPPRSMPIRIMRAKVAQRAVRAASLAEPRAGCCIPRHDGGHHHPPRRARAFPAPCPCSRPTRRCAAWRPAPP